MGAKNTLTSCLTEAGNTGVGDCYTDIGMPRVFFLVPDKATFTTEDLASFVAALKAAILNNIPRNRVFPIQNIVNIDDQTEKSVIQTFNTGAKAKVRPGFYDITGQWTVGGFCVLFSLLKANGRNKRILVGTDTGLILGTDAGDPLNPELMKGYKPALIDVEPYGFSDGSKKATYQIHLNYEPTQANQGIAFMDMSPLGGLSAIEELEGLQNAALSEGAATIATAITVKALTACGSADLYDDFADNLMTPDAWTLKREDTGAAVTISGVTKSDSLKAWILTFVTPGLNKKLDVSMVGPTDLAADPILVIGYESNVLVTTTPAS